MQRYHLQIDDGVCVAIDEGGAEFSSADAAFSTAAELAGRILAEGRLANGDRRIEVRIETDLHVHIGTVTASLRSA